MIKVRDVIEVMEKWAPSSLAENWDNVGLITGDPDSNTTSVMVTLDITDETITHAINNNTSLIITHHPPIFKPLNNLTGTTLSTRVIRKAIKEDIAIYASHTNLDQAPDGVSFTLARKIKLNSISPLSPGTSYLVKITLFTPPDYTDRIFNAVRSKVGGVVYEYRLCSFTSRQNGTSIPSKTSQPFQGKPEILSRVTDDRLEMLVPAPFVSFVVEEARKVHPYEEMRYDVIPLSNPETTFGYGAIGNLKENMNSSQFTDYVAGILGVTSLTISKVGKRLIKKVAIMGGSGKNYIDRAVAKEADAYITGDLGYHNFMEYGQSILLIDASHRATEMPVLETIKKRLISSVWGERIKVIIDVGEELVTNITYL